MIERYQMHLLLRTASPEDAVAAGSICHAAFETIAERHGFPPDFPDPDAAIGLVSQLIPRADIYAVVAEIDGRVVGSNFLWEDEVAGVGPITVNPAVQDAGVGRGLMQAVVERARAKSIAAVRLVQAAYHGRSLSLYTKLGFDAREPLSVMQGRPLSLTVEGFAVRTMTAADMEAADDLCRRVHGHARHAELRAAIEQSVASAVDRQGRITGYTTSIGFFGHTVGEATEDLQALIGAAQLFPGPGFLVPTRDALLMRWCLNHGLHIVQPMILMTMGPYREPRGAFLPSVLY
jgi:predicted N-acetyltransferase YhbS